MMTSSSFDFRVYLKNIFALEPLLKLATFVVEEVISQNVKKKFKKIIPHRCYRRRRSVGRASACCKAGPSSILGSAPQGGFPTEQTSDEEMERGLSEWRRMNVIV